jgi:hypothetical protein
LIALAARYTGWTARGWDALDGFDTHPAFQISGRFGYAFGKTREEEASPHIPYAAKEENCSADV